MSEKRHRSSGAEFRKTKVVWEPNKKKQSGSLLKYLKTSDPAEIGESSKSATKFPEHCEVEMHGKKMYVSDEWCINLWETTKNFCRSRNVAGVNKWWVSNGDYKKKPQKCCVNFNFPRILSGRRFSVNYYKRQLCNGGTFKRNWLVYSPSKDVVFCFCCKLFPTRVFYQLVVIMVGLICQHI